MKTIKYTQFGTFSVIIMLPIIIFLIIMLIMSEFNDPVFVIILTFVIVVLLICLLIFYKLTIYIDDTCLAFKLGIGLIKKEYALADIADCKPVKNSVWYGIGIRLTSNGWLYNVSGLYAIEITFKNKKSKIRIGTNKPEEISQMISKFLNRSESGSANISSNHSGYYVLLSIILIGLFLPIILVISGSQDTKLEFSDSSFKIKGIYGLTVDYSKIVQIDTLNILPKIKARTNGYALGKTLKGNFKLYDQSKIKLYVEKGIPPYIYIKTNETDLYLNFVNPVMTTDIYKKITTNLKIRN
jgi:hypothetical protein